MKTKKKNKRHKENEKYKKGNRGEKRKNEQPIAEIEETIKERMYNQEKEWMKNSVGIKTGRTQVKTKMRKTWTQGKK